MSHDIHRSRPHTSNLTGSTYQMLSRITATLAESQNDPDLAALGGLILSSLLNWCTNRRPSAFQLHENLVAMAKARNIEGLEFESTTAENYPDLSPQVVGGGFFCEATNVRF
jgi:hypothetical protein